MSRKRHNSMAFLTLFKYYTILFVCYFIHSSLLSVLLITFYSIFFFLTSMLKHAKYNHLSDAINSACHSNKIVYTCTILCVCVFVWQIMIFKIEMKINDDHGMPAADVSLSIFCVILFISISIKK